MRHKYTRQLIGRKAGNPACRWELHVRKKRQLRNDYVLQGDNDAECANANHRKETVPEHRENAIGVNALLGHEVKEAVKANGA
jgi:hypothetical protein